MNKKAHGDKLIDDEECNALKEDVPSFEVSQNNENEFKINSINHHYTYEKLIDKIKGTTDNIKLSDCYFTLGEFYRLKAEKEEQWHVLKSLQNWQFARENYKNSLKFNKKNYKAVSAKAKSLLKLSKFSQVISLLDEYTKDEETKKIKDYYLFKSMAFRKQFKYKEAKIELDKIDENDKLKPEYIKESSIQNKIETHNVEKKLKSYHDCNKKLIKNDLNDASKINEKYRILSIDGGGIRGIIPAIMCCEIERRAKKPLSSIFNLMSGTSTGGIIAAALACPKDNNPHEPQHTAHDILELYRNEGPNIFTLTPSLLIAKLFHQISNTKLRIFNSIYSSEGRLKLFKTYFKEKKIGDSLTELVIPAAYEESLYSTYLFNRFDAKDDPFKNDTYVDALMATSAAPTYFPSHEIVGKGLFNDGGVHVNNPASVACSEALRYGASKENLVVLSMGTGTNLPDAFDRSHSRGVLFWASHLDSLALQAQCGNTDIAMFNALGKNYHRWQVWLENPITLDDYSKKNIDVLLESANQFIEEGCIENVPDKLMFRSSLNEEMRKQVIESMDVHEDNYFNKFIDSIE